MGPGQKNKKLSGTHNRGSNHFLKFEILLCVSEIRKWVFEAVLMLMPEFVGFPTDVILSLFHAKVVFCLEKYFLCKWL